MELVTHMGISLEINPELMSKKMMDVLRGNNYEGAESKQINKLIQDNEVVLEVGAGIGFVSSLIVKNPLTKRAISFEANPLLIETIDRTVKRNVRDAGERWEVRNAVLKTGDAKGDADFYVHHDFWASSLAPMPNPLRVDRVPYAGFNEVVSDLRPTMIVCDIEGGELDLFRNADLTGVKKVFMEIHQARLGRRGIKHLFECFHARDFHYDQHHSAGSVILFSHVNR